MNKERLDKLRIFFEMLGLDFSECKTDDEKLAKIMSSLPILLVDRKEYSKARRLILGYVFEKKLSKKLL